jgi:DNA polymerase III delta prime subunit
MSFIDKYRPTSVSETVFNDAATHKRVEQYATGKRAGNIILQGPKGTTKSTTARIICEELARNVDCGYPVPVYQASGLTLENMDKIWNDWSWQRSQGMENPYVIIEEVDQLTAKAQHKLRSMLDEASVGKAIMTTNNIHAVDVPLVDRCDEIEMPLANTDMWFDRARTILDAEGVECSNEQLQALLKTCNGSIRDLMNALEDYVLERK